MVLYNPRTKAVHDADCRWLDGASKGKDPIDLSTYELLPDTGPFPEGAHRVSCCAPNVDKARLRTRPAAVA